MYDTQGISRDQKAGWSNEQLREIILKLGKRRDRSPDQETLLMFLLEVATGRQQAGTWQSAPAADSWEKKEPSELPAANRW
jgi:hypothetical protein